MAPGESRPRKEEEYSEARVKTTGKQSAEWNEDQDEMETMEKKEEESYEETVAEIPWEVTMQVYPKPLPAAW